MVAALSPSRVADKLAMTRGVISKVVDGWTAKCLAPRTPSAAGRHTSGADAYGVAVHNFVQAGASSNPNEPS